MHYRNALVSLLALTVGSLTLAAAATTTSHHATAGGPRALGACSMATSQISVANYNALGGTPARATISWNYSCRSLRGGPNLSPQSFTVSGASQSGGDLRHMSDGRGHQLAYFLCVDPNCAMPIGSGQGNLNVAVRTSNISAGSAVAGSLLLYVLIPAHQNVPVGKYTDTLTLDLEY